MLEKYRATIHGDRIEWEGEPPNELADGCDVEVEVTIVNELKGRSKPNGKRMADALKALADLPPGKGLRSIKDPVKWQRSIRKDRPLPGR